jgi:hydrogenase nickel incorporation protein HypA/HybF
MHEASIVSSLIAILDRQARLHDVKRIRRVNLKVGQLKAVEPQALVACFEAFAEGSVADAAELCIEHVPARARCRTCQAETAIHRFHFVCETCGGGDLALTAGEELYIESFEPA